MKKYKIYFAGKINAEWRNIFTEKSKLSKINPDCETYYIDQYTGYTSAQSFEVPFIIVHSNTNVGTVVQKKQIICHNQYVILIARLLINKY
jgi:hypothetical protein